MRKIGMFLLIALAGFILVSCRDSRIQVGILQFVSHQDLDDARRGFIEELEKAGFKDKDNIKITLLNPQTDAVTMQTQAAQLVRKSDLLLGIATPAAVALVNEVKAQGKNTPVLFTAVTDPVAAGLVESNEAPGGFVTGTSDMNPIEKQLSLVKRIKPDATKVGILFTAGEPNSLIQANIAAGILEEIGLEPIIKTITNAADIPQVFNALAKEVDVIYIPSDNGISSNMGAIETGVEANKTIVIPATAFQVEEGGSLTYGFSYLELGKQTGVMAGKILKGTDPKEIKVEIIEETNLIINLRILKEVIGIEIPSDLLEEAKTIIE